MKAVALGVPLLQRGVVGLVLWAIALLGVAAGDATASSGADPSLGTRKALVIGNDTYQSIPTLTRARADATAIAAALTDLGFSVALRTDLDGRAMRTALREFVASLRGGDEAVVYFAGHGVQLGTANYLLPVDAPADEEAHVRDESMPLQRVLDALVEREARASVVIVDACRDNPFPKVEGRSIGRLRGLATTSPATGQLVMFSAGAGQTALDSLGSQDKSPHGVFTRVLLEQLRRPEASADQILRDVRERVVELARSVGHQQVPALYDQMVGRFYFTPGVPSGLPAPTDDRRAVAALAATPTESAVAATPATAGGAARVPGPSTTTYQMPARGIRIETNPNGAWQRIYATGRQPVGSTDRRAITLAQRIAEQRAKAQIVDFLNQDVSHEVLVRELDSSTSSGQSTEPASASPSTPAPTRALVSSLEETIRSVSRGTLRGVVVLGSGYDERTEEAWVEVGITQPGLGIARSVEEASPARKRR